MLVYFLTNVCLRTSQYFEFRRVVYHTLVLTYSWYQISERYEQVSLFHFFETLLYIITVYFAVVIPHREFDSEGWEMDAGEV